MLLATLGISIAFLLSPSATTPSLVASNTAPRTVTLTFDRTAQYLTGFYDTTAPEDVFVTTIGSRGPILWGTGTMERDPTGGLEDDRSRDPSGTQYEFTVTWFDALQNQTAQITRSVTKP